MLYGPAHVVWADENWECAQRILDTFDTFAEQDMFSPQQLSVVRESLERLAALPDIFKFIPDEWHTHPDIHPPPKSFACEWR